MSISVSQAEANGRSLANGGYHGTGATWAEQCQAFISDATLMDSAWSAADARNRSGPLSAPASSAPRGAFHWWDCCGGDGHVALDLDGGGSRVMMSSGHALPDSWSHGCGTISVSGYNSIFPGNTYLGWTNNSIGQTLSDVGSSPVPSVPPLSNADGQTLQKLAQFGGYGGPVDGVPGGNTWKGVQTALRSYGYGGPIDGVPGNNTYIALQKLAADGGYGGPIDGVPGPATYAGVAAWVSAHTTTPIPSSQRGVYGIDTATSQASLNFPGASASGFQWAIVKAGGSNVAPTYVAPHYQDQVDAARNAKMIVGHYWVCGLASPASDAAYFLAHLYDFRSGDLLALDNEGVDSHIVWTDAQVATFMNAVKSAVGYAPFHYTTRSILASQTWTATQATGSKLWIADPDHAPGSPQYPNYPDWAIHQYGQSSLGGIATDVNIAKLSAFAGLATPPFGETLPPSGNVPPASPPSSISIANGQIIQKVAQLGGYSGPVDGALGTNSWIGMQKELTTLGYYTGPIDGTPGTNTYKGMQLLAADYGYQGPIDGAPGTNTYAGLQAFLNVQAGGVPPIGSGDGQTLQRIAKAGGYVGVIDGAPGSNTWKGVQTVLTGYGYTGPQDGSPGTNTYAALQRLAQKGGYTGVIDGVMGTNSWKGVQTILQAFGYTGPIDGAPGNATYQAMQRLARLGGYTGPIDGALGSYSWKGLQKLFAGAGYTGPVDGVPGSNTYKALQSLATRGGYVGPIDGIPGPLTYQALARLLS